MNPPAPPTGPTRAREFGGVAMEAITGTPVTAPSAATRPARATAAVDPTDLSTGLTVRFEAAGLTVAGPDPGSSRTAPWAAVVDVRFGESGVLPDGTLAVSLSAVVSGWSVRWWIPWSQILPGEVGALDRLLARLVPRTAGSLPFRRTLRVLQLAIVALVVAGAVVLAIGLAGSGNSQGQSPAGAGNGDAGDRVLAAQINLDRADFPHGWAVDSSKDGPLRAFLGGNGGDTPNPSAAQLREVREVGRQYEGCMGITASQDRMFGTTGPLPSAQVSSPAFAAPSTVSALEAGSQTAVYPSATTVRADVAQITDGRFPSCFGAAIGKEFVEASKGAAGTSGVTYGTPTVQQLQLPERGQAHAVGLDLSVPVAEGGQPTSLQFGFVFLGYGRVQTSLITFGTPTGFPTGLTGTLTTALERNLIAERAATGT